MKNLNEFTIPKQQKDYNELVMIVYENWIG